MKLRIFETNISNDELFDFSKFEDASIKAKSLFHYEDGILFKDGFSTYFVPLSET